MEGNALYKSKALLLNPRIHRGGNTECGAWVIWIQLFCTFGITLLIIIVFGNNFACFPTEGGMIEYNCL